MVPIRYGSRSEGSLQVDKRIGLWTNIWQKKTNSDFSFFKKNSFLSGFALIILGVNFCV